MYITIKFGDDKSLIFNPNCRNNVLLHNIKERCKFDCEVDLSDETGAVKNLHRNLSDYCSEYCTDREILILLRVQKHALEADEDTATYIPLLAGKEEDKAFLEKLNSRRTRSLSKSRRGSEDSEGRGSSVKRRGSNVNKRGSIAHVPRRGSRLSMSGPSAAKK